MYHYQHHPPPPRLDFPLFDGENAKVWQLKCENYFRICVVQPEFKVSIATMFFTGGALLWLQTSHAHSRFDTWEAFVEAVCRRFGKEEFQQILRQFNHLRQSSTVADYTEKFNELMHNLLAHHTSWNPVFLSLSL